MYKKARQQDIGQRKKPNIQKNVVFSSCQGSKQQLKLFSPRKPAGLHRIVMFVSLFEIPNHYFQLHRTQNWCRNSPYTSHTWQSPPPPTLFFTSTIPQNKQQDHLNYSMVILDPWASCKTTAWHWPGHTAPGLRHTTGADCPSDQQLCEAAAILLSCLHCPYCTQCDLVLH